MTKWMRFACLAVCVLCTLFCAVGYAAISGNLTISGQVELVALPPPEKVVITNVELMPGSTATSNSFNFTNQATLLTNTITGQAGDKVIYKITAHNYSPTIKYAYMEQADATAELNENLTVAVMAADASGNMTETVFAPGTAVLPGEDIVFYAVYTVTTTVDHVDSVVNYPFGIHVDSAGAGAMQGATETFLNILNTQSEDLQNLFDCMGRDFTGNVVPDNGSGGLVNSIYQIFNQELGAEQEAANDLFGESLTITYTDENGVKHEQTMATIIARENVDGRPGDEMVLYLTPFNFDNAKISSSDVRVPVLAAVFTNTLYEETVTEGNTTYEPKGTWFQLGEIYEGAANCATWIGSNIFGGVRDNQMGNPFDWGFPILGAQAAYYADCFDPSTWRAGKVTTYQEGETGGIAGTVKSTANRTYTHDNIKTAGGASFSYTIIANDEATLASIMTTPAGDNQALLCDEVYAANGALSKVDGIYAKIEAGNVYGNVTVDSPATKNLLSTQSSAEAFRTYYNNDITPMTLPEALTAHQVVDAVAPFLNASTE